MDYLETLGVDVSKLTIDCHLFTHQTSEQFENSNDGFNKLFKWIESQHIDLKELLVCFECTGAYSFP